MSHIAGLLLTLFVSFMVEPSIRNGPFFMGVVTYCFGIFGVQALIAAIRAPRKP